MADYWKSQPKKFCKYCKCWIADNKPSVEFHERGKNHKENVSAKIAEIKQKSLDKAKQEDRMSKEFAAMEAAAQKAYEEDMKRLGIESGSPAQTQPQTQPKPAPQVQPPPQRKEKKQKGAGKGPRQPVRESDAWVEGKSDDGVTYYFNTVTGESQWVKPEDAESSTSTQSESKWMEAVSPEGYTYYYNTETGESSWERPADLPTGSGSGAEVKDGESSDPKTEPPSGGEESAGGATGAKDGEGGGEESKQTQIPKISFRKRKGEESSEKERTDADNGGGKEEGDEGRRDEEGDKMAVAPPVEEKKAPAKKPRRTTPYGAWEQIQEEEDPYEKVDLQLPQVEGASCVPAPTELPKEPKPRFKERTITSLGGDGGPASFRKRKAENGKSRSIRQRGEDD